MSSRIIGLIALCMLVITVTAHSRVIPCLSGFVRDTGGNPIAGADLDFFNSTTGVKLITPGDNTDASGFYNVCVLPGIYDVTYAPPPGTRLMGKLVPRVDLRADAGVALDVVLEHGTVVDGRVTSLTGGLPVAGVDIDVDRVGGTRVFTPNDNTDANGDYRLVIPDGMFRFRYEPFPGSRLRGVQIDSVTVQGDTTLDVTLPEGLLLEGRVSSSAGPGLPDVDIDIRDWATGAKIFVANNTTGLGGNYSVSLPTGTFELRFSPERGAPYVAVALDSFVMSGDRTVDQVLDSGHVVTFVVEDPTGAPVAAADLDVKIAATGEKVFSPYDMTLADGTAVAALASNTYRFQIEPPPGAPLDRMVLDNVTISADTTITVQLPEAARVTVIGQVVDEFAAGVGGVEFEARLKASDTAVFIPDPFTNANGDFVLSIPVGFYNVFVAPPTGSRLIAVELPDVTVAADSTWGVIALTEGVLVTVEVRGPSGQWISGADLDVFEEPTGLKVFTPHDNTGPDTPAEAALPPGSYAFTVTPPSGSPYDVTSLTGVTITQDTLLVIPLATGSSNGEGGAKIEQVRPNPFQAQTTLQYTVPQPANVSVHVYNVAGQLVQVLTSGFHIADTFEVNWDGTNQSGAPAASGVYFVRLNTSAGIDTRKIILVR